MNIVLAQLKKDLICQRRPLIALVICAVLSIVPFLLLPGVFHALPAFDPKKSGSAVMLGAMSLVGLTGFCAITAMMAQFLLLPLIVVRVVQEDSLLGTTAFWRTRPLPRGQFLAAKALLIALLPMPLLLISGNNTHFGSGNFLFTEPMMLAAFASVAAITSGTKEFLIYIVALVFGKSVFAGILGRIWRSLHGDSFSHVGGVGHAFPGVPNEVYLSGSDFYHLCYFMGLSAVFVHQYLTLQTRRSLLILITVIVVITIMEILGGLPTSNPSEP